MAGYTNFVENTAFPVDEHAADQMSADAKQRKFFDSYYTKVGSVDPAQYDIVRGFLQRKNLEETSIDNLTISLLEVAKEQGLNPIDMVQQLDDIEDKLKLNTLLCILLNTTRNRTSVLGYSTAKTVSTKIRRAILA